MVNRKWRLPDGVDELLPPEAWALEQVRRQVLDVFNSWGFDYVEPPVVEYLDALLVGAGPDGGLGHQDDLDLQTLKVVDQRSGRLMGVRADMTAQAVRIDAHSRPSEGVQRLCYAGPVVLANPAAALDSRVPLKAGAEVFGAPGLAADVEVICLLLEILERTGVEAPVLVLGHMGIYLSLVAPLGLDAFTERQLFAAVQSKSEADIGELIGERSDGALLERLPTLMGGREILREARAALAGGPDGAVAAVDALEELAEAVLVRNPAVEVRYDLAELAGYGYHNGPVFSAYQADQGRAIARGGRYDGIGAPFGRSRPATGFDVNLRQLIGLAGAGTVGQAVWAPWTGSLGGDVAAALAAEVRRLRAAGERVVVALDDEDGAPSGCDRQLSYVSGVWKVERLGRNEG
ncbi:MAG TPA: ATP phosphoribosyltransferase regulatory subunit [Pseudomonadales bacterium]|jgi:ATP phosphoribosyltransferase regulatory subunit